MILFPLRRRKKQKRMPNLHETYMDKDAVGEGFSPLHAEGRLRRSIKPRQVYVLMALFVGMLLLLVVQVGNLQLVNGAEYRFISEHNTFSRVPVLPVRGEIRDRNGEVIAWNVQQDDGVAPIRQYRNPGFSALLGFIRYPQKDSSGKYFRSQTEGAGGVEEIHDTQLAGSAGSFILERNANGAVISELYVEQPTDGESVDISIDATAQGYLFDAIRTIVDERDFQAGSGVVMHSDTGEILALVSYPEFDNNALTGGESDTSRQGLREREYIHRAVSGLYSPGSTIKPFFGVAALEEGIISPERKIQNKGFITIQNPYDPSVVYTYRDWKPHGPLNLYGALAHSSNVYFYHVGGGYGSYTGLGIDRLNRYATLFGFGTPTSLGVFHEPNGLVPSRAWKETVHGERWQIGDTYNTVIGQYSFQTTPLQLARATAVLVNGGYLVTPHFTVDERKERVQLNISAESLGIVRRAMRGTITQGTARYLDTKQYTLAVKTGTAQIGEKDFADSLLIGFFPYEKPRYVFVIVMERGKLGGAMVAAKKFFDALMVDASHYLTAR